MKQLNQEKNKANFDIKHEKIKMERGVKGDSKFNDWFEEKLEWDPLLNKNTLGGKSVKKFSKIEENSETPNSKERIRSNTTAVKKTAKSKGILTRGHGCYRCNSLGYMQEHLRFGRFVCPSDLLRVKLEQRDLCRCIPCCYFSLYQTCMPYKFIYQCCVAPGQ
ncbi:uncharacterized protein Dyak_GE28614 [Drosophila yakuba]|uniref:Uncharacterized protein n=1 Tax=Drosophila yakuba TaxID=7245 RepID=A0A0R1E7A2_DROYA|nr:uncharacterized protein Dyak_GE28614 [Drosophila yakuba]